MNKIKVASVFSGIGAPEFALKRLGVDYEIVFACDNGERDIEYDINKQKNIVFNLPSIDDKKKYVDDLYLKNTSARNFVQDSYLANYPQIKESRFFQDIVLLDGRDFYNKVDLLIGGSPCQSFSMVGKKGGLEDARGTLFYEFARLIKEIKPKVFIYENVRNLLKHDGGKTWKVIKNVFDSLGYKYTFDVLNAADYGIPQNRRRLFVVGFLEDNPFRMPPKVQDLKYFLNDFLIDNCDYGCFGYKKDGSINVNYCPGHVNPEYILTKKLYDYVMSGGTKNFYTEPKINLPIARTILKTMGHRHRAGVDNYVSFNGSTKLGDVRMLTEREALRLMGFTDDFKIVVSKAQTYRQAGNSIVVDLLMAILREVIETGVFEGE